MKIVKDYILEQVLSNSLSKEKAAEMLEQLITNKEGNSDDDIAIIGLGCKFSQADSLDEFAQNIFNGKDFIKDFPNDRKKDVGEILEQTFKIQDEEIKYMKGAYLDRIDLFDNDVFNLTPGEAKVMDPQQRIFLEIAWRTLEDAGYSKEKISGKKVGVYIGYSESQYKELIGNNEPSAVPGNLPAIIAGRVSYLFNLQGPTEAIDTTCSSSLVALHEGCQAIKNTDCDMAIVGGIKLNLFPIEIENYGVRTEASDYRCKAFDEKADGIGLGEGCGAVMIKSLKKAIKDGDYVYAVIKGSSINSDGRSNGITAPNASAQTNVIIDAWKRSGINPKAIGYIEAHGTGTKLGDHIEIQGLNNAIKTFTDKKQYIPIGSVKTNIGHLDSAAGIAGLFKVLAMLKFKKLPPSLHFQKESPLLELNQSAFYVNTQLKNWDSEYPRIAALSSFGLSGTNCHLILEEFNNEKEYERRADIQKQIFTLSANTKFSLRELAKSFVKYLEVSTDINLENVCYSVNTGKNQLKERITIITENRQDLILKLNKFIELSSESVNGINAYKNLFGIDEGCDEHLINIANKYINGEKIDWKSVYYEKKIKRVPIPGYVFDNKRFWIEDKKIVPKEYIDKKIENNNIKEIFDTTFAYGELILDTLDIKYSEDINKTLDELSCALIVKCFKKLGMFLNDEKAYSYEEFMDKFKILPQYDRLCRFMFGILLKNQIIYEEKNKFILRDRNYNENQIYETIKSKILLDKQYKDIFILLDHCLSNYSEVLIGEVNPLSLLYPKGNQNFIKELRLETGELSETYSIMALEAIEKYVDSFEGRKVNILEVGGGNGSFTDQILPRLKNKNVEYTFTDIGNYFIVNAKKRFEKYPFLKYCTYNIENDPIEQGLEYKQFDLIVGLNVVHATSNIRKVIKNLKKLLNNDGLLALMEDVKNSNWTTLVWGMTEGWWLFEDTDLRDSSPLLDDDKWNLVFNEEFSEVMTYPESKIRRKLTENILIVGKNSSHEIKTEDINKQYFRLNWIQTDQLIELKEKVENGLWVIYEDSMGIANNLKYELEQENNTVVMVRPNEKYEKLSQVNYSVNPVSSEDIEVLLNDIKSNSNKEFRGVIHLWSCNDKCINNIVIEEIQENQKIGAYSLFTLVKAITKIFPKNKVDIEIVANNVNKIIEDDKVVSPEKATIHGFSRAIPQEFPKVSCYFTDIDINEDIEIISKNIVDEMSTKSTNRNYSIGYRKGKRYIQQIEKLEVNKIKDRDVILRDNGVYIVAGGAGYLGLRCCYTLAKRNNAKFILINRTEMPPRNEWGQLIETIDKESKLYYQLVNIKEIERLGSEVICYSGDLCDIESMQNILKDIKEKYKNINGVINAMMMINKKKIEDLSLKELSLAIESKIKGTIILDKLTENEKLDFYVLCSSITSIFAGISRSDCSAANMFLDVYGEYRNSMNRQTTVLNLPGITARKLDAWEQKHVALPEISIDEFGEIFYNLLEKETRFAMIEDFNFNEVKKILPLMRFAFSQKLIDRNLEVKDIKVNEENNIIKKKIVTIQDYSNFNYKGAVKEIWSEVLGFEEIDEDADFFEIGGDSLMAIKILDLIKEKIGIEIEVSDIFSYPTINKLSAYLSKDSGSEEEINDPLMDLLKTMEDGKISMEEAMSDLIDKI